MVLIAVPAALSELRAVEFAALSRLEENSRGGRPPYFRTGCGEVVPFARFIGAVEGRHLGARARPARDQARQFRFIEAPKPFIERQSPANLRAAGHPNRGDPRVSPARSGQLDAPNVGAPRCGAAPLGPRTRASRAFRFGELSTSRRVSTTCAARVFSIYPALPS